MAHSTEQTTTVCMAGPRGDAGGRTNLPAAARADAAGQSLLYMRFGESVSDALARLYKDPVAAVQEIVANAVAACKAARQLHGADAYIRVHACGRNLSIEDRNSMGMSWDVFRNVYARAGSSLKMGPDGAATPGMFGCGSLSYVLVSDIMFLASHSRETGERYEVMACDGRGFQTGLPEPDMEWYGTRVRLTIRKDVGMQAVFNRIAAIAGACGVRIVVDLDHADDSFVPSCSLRNRALDEDAVAEAEAEVMDDVPVDAEEAPPGTDGIDRTGGMTGRYVFEASTFDDKVRRQLDRLSGGSGAGTEYVCVRAESDDLEVAAINRCNSDGYYDNTAAVCRTYLAGMPIDQPYGSRRSGASWVGRMFDGWVVLIHAKNERKYMPTPDRERFAEKTSKRLAIEVDRLLIDKIRAIRPATLAEYLSDPSNRALEPYATYRTEPYPSRRTERSKINGPRMHAEDNVDERMVMMARAAGPVSIKAKDAGVSLWSLLYRSAENGGHDGRHGRIDEPLLVVYERPNDGVRKAVMDHAASEGRASVVVFSPHQRNTLSVDDYIGLGCESAAKYMERNGLVVARKAAAAGPKGRRGAGAQRTKAEYVVHCGGRGESGKRWVYVPVLTSERIPVDSAPSGARTVVRCGDSESFGAMQGALAALECDTVCATRERSAVRGVVEFDGYADAAGDMRYDTTIGHVSGRELAGCGRRIVLVVYDRPAWRTADLAALLADAWRRRNGGNDGCEAVYVIGRPGVLAGCAAHLWRSSAGFGVWMLPYYSQPRIDVLAGKSYLNGMMEHGHSPAKAAAKWVRTAFDQTSTQYGRDARNDAMELLHASLEGEAALRSAGIEYDGDKAEARYEEEWQARYNIDRIDNGGHADGGDAAEAEG